MDFVYAGSLGRIKALTPSFLTPGQYQALLNARDLTEVGKVLEGTWYGPEITRAQGSYAGEEAFEVGINRQFVRLNRFAYQCAPFAGRPVVGAYLRRWDVENIGLILSAKAYGRLLSDTETFLVSDRESAEAPGAGLLGIDDLRGLLALPSVEAVANQLVRFGYGSVLLERLEAFHEHPDVFFLVQALERQYLEQLRASVRFFQGDEWVVRQFVAQELDRRNALALLKGVELHIPPEDLATFFLEGGGLSAKAFADLAALPGVPEVVAGLGSALPLSEALSRYTQEHSLVPFEEALRRWALERTLTLTRQYPLSLAGIFGFLLQAEVERSDLRRIVYGKVYALPEERLSAELLGPRIR
jgi:V/A-type H+-transporting ATPase subunit C